MDVEFANLFVDKINIISGGIIAILTYILGEHWAIFFVFLLLNVADYMTRWIAARITRTENSKKGMFGILKKLGYWIMVAVGFGMSVIFKEIGEIVGVQMHATNLIGWFVLGALITNEFRSILENLVDADYNVPVILTKGLEIADDAMDKQINKLFNTKDSDESDDEEETENTQNDFDDDDDEETLG